MTKIQKSRVFNSSADICFDTLLEVFPRLQITVQSQSATSRTILSYWSGKAKAQLTIEAVCSPISESSASVSVTYRPDLTPWLKKPATFAVQPEIEEKMNLIFMGMAQSLQSPGDTGRLKAMKLDQLTDKWQWFDWVIFLAITAPIVLLLPSAGTTFLFRTFERFGIGAFLGVLYHITLRRLWASRFPHLYRQWICSNCRARVPGEATVCPKCKAELGIEKESDQ